MIDDPVAVGKAFAEEIAIAAASDLNFAIKDLITEYEKATGNHVKLSLGSSGNFYAQIQNGAPFDVYFSADIGYPKKLEEAGLTVPGSLYRYAVGRIVLWTNNASARDVSKGLELLRDPAVKKIAIANPKHVGLLQPSSAAEYQNGGGLCRYKKRTIRHKRAGTVRIAGCTWRKELSVWTA